MNSIKCLAAAIAAIMALGTHATAAEPTKLRFADSFPLTHIVSKYNANWLKRMEELSGGQYKFDYFPAEQLAKAPDLLDAVINRVADMAFVGPLYNADRLPLSTVTAIPLVGNVSDIRALYAAYWKLADEELNQLEFLPLGVRVIRVVMATPTQILSTRKQIQTLDEFRGLKVRVSGGIQEGMIKHLGAVGVSIPAPDVYTAVQRGTVDAMLFNWPSVSSYKLQELIKFSTRSLNLGLFPSVFVVNEKVWQGLSPETRAAFLQAGQDSVDFEVPDLEKQNEALLAEFARRKILAYDLSDSELARWQVAVKPVQQEWVDRLVAQKKPADRIMKKWEQMLTK